MRLSWTSRDAHVVRALNRAMIAISNGADDSMAILDCMMEIIQPPMPREHMPALYVSLCEQWLEIRKAVKGNQEHLVCLEALLLANHIDPTSTSIDVALMTEFILECKGEPSYRVMIERERVAQFNKARGDGAMDSEQFLKNLPAFLKDSLSPDAQERRERLMKEADNE